MASGSASYAVSATNYGRNSADSYFILSAPDVVNGSLEITGNLKVDGTTQLVGAVTADSTITAAGAVTAGSVTTAGNVNCAAVTATGAVNSATLSVSGASVLAGVTAGAVGCTSVAASGAVNAVNMAASSSVTAPNILTGAALAASPTLSAGVALSGGSATAFHAPLFALNAMPLDGATQVVPLLSTFMMGGANAGAFPRVLFVSIVANLNTASPGSWPTGQSIYYSHSIVTMPGTQTNSANFGAPQVNSLGTSGIGVPTWISGTNILQVTSPTVAGAFANVSVVVLC